MPLLDSIHSCNSTITLRHVVAGPHLALVDPCCSKLQQRPLLMQTPVKALVHNGCPRRAHPSFVRKRKQNPSTARLTSGNKGKKARHSPGKLRSDAFSRLTADLHHKGTRSALLSLHPHPRPSRSSPHLASPRPLLPLLLLRKVSCCVVGGGSRRMAALERQCSHCL